MVALNCVSFSYLDGPLLKRFFIVFVRLNLSSGNLGSGFKKAYHYTLKLQRRPAKFLDRYKILNYKERLKKLDLPSLREKFELIWLRCTSTFIFTTQLYYQRDLSPTIVWIASTFTRWNKIFQIKGVRGVKTNLFYYRTIETWNELSKVVTHAENMFKTKLDKDCQDFP